jgi:hypothetical protein
MSSGIRRASGRSSSSLGRLAVVVMLGIQALCFSLVAFGNITDYGTTCRPASSDLC